MTRFHVVLFILIVVVSGCNKRPKNILDEKTMVEIMAEIQIAEAYDRNGKSESDMSGDRRQLLGRGILESHGVSVAEMDSTLAWYGKNMDEYAKLYKKVDQRLSKMQVKYARAAGESEENSGPSADLWPFGRHYVIDRNQLTDGLIVNIPVPDLTVGDKLIWKLRTQGASSRLMTLGVEYEDGHSELVTNKKMNMEPWIESSLQTDTLSKVANIFAVLSVEQTSPRVFVDSIQLIHYPFNREEYNNKTYQKKIGKPQRIEKNPTDTVSAANTDTIEISQQTAEISQRATEKAPRHKRELGAPNSEKLMMTTDPR